MIIFIYGADTYRSRQKLNELKDKFVSEIDAASQSLIVLDGKITNLKEISEKINTGSLFVKKRMVVIEDILENKNDKLFSELNLFLNKREGATKNSDDNIIVFREGNLNDKNRKLKKEAQKLFSFLLKQQYVQEFKTLSNLQLNDFIKKAVLKLNRKIESAAILTLVTRTNSDLWQISSELHKLAMSIPDAKEITNEAVKAQVANIYDENIFALTDAISARNKKAALTLLEEQYLAGVSEDYILAMLIRQFKILLQIKSSVLANFSVSQIADELKIHAYVVKKNLPQTKGFILTDLKNHLSHLISLDFKNKTGQGETKAELALFLTKL